MPNFVAAASFNRRCHQQHGSLLLCAAWNTLFRGSFRSSSSSNSRQHVAHWESRNPDTSTDSVIVRPTYLRTLTAPRNYSCTAAILSNKTNNDDAEEKLVAVWVRFCVDQGPLESDAVRLAIPATTPANCGIQVQALQRAVKDQCGHDEPALQGVPASWLQIHSSSSSFFQHRRPRTHQRSKKPPVPLDRNDIWDGTVHGGTSAETALVVHIDQANGTCVSYARLCSMMNG